MEWMNIFTNPITCISAVLIVALVVGLVIFLTLRGVKFKSDKFSIDTNAADSNTRVKVIKQIDYVHQAVKNVSPTIDMLLVKFINDSHLRKSINDSLQCRIEIMLTKWVVENHIGSTDTEIETYCKRKIELLLGMINTFLSKELNDYTKDSWDDDIKRKLNVNDIDIYVYNCLFKTIKNAKAEAEN